MFITYLRRELRRRMRQAIFIALGLALGIGLVITVTAASAGVSDTQSTVLHSLYGVGTDVTVTQAPTAGSGGAAHFNIGGGSGSKPSAGTSFNRNILSGTGLGTLKSSSVTTIGGLKNVSAAAGSLALTDLKLSGTIPSGSSGQQGGGGTGSARSSLKSSTFSVTGVDLSSTSVGPLSSATISSGRDFTSADSTSNVTVVSSDYATAQSLKTGSKITIAGKKFTVVGVVKAAQGSTSADVYIPLARAQSLASMKNEVNTIYVSAASAADISTVSKEISTALPKTTVTTSSDLASEVTGSLSSASSLANNLGKWLAAAVLAAAFCLASLLTVAAVSRRVREFGTLKALGWRSRRIIRQIMGEALVTGLIGGAAGVALGYAGAALVQSLAPPLTATTGASATGASGAPGGGGGGFAHAAAAATKTVSVHLTAPVTLSAVALAVVLAIAGGLIAGSFGGWRAVRLRPAAALARVE
jgi:ABC-type lipoprotein release transport system permease subunit